MRRLFFLIGIIGVVVLLFRFVSSGTERGQEMKQSVIIHIAARGLDATGNGFIWIGHWLKQTDPEMLTEQIETQAVRIRNQFELPSRTNSISEVGGDEESAGEGTEATSSSGVYPLSELFLPPKTSDSP